MPANWRHYNHLAIHHPCTLLIVMVFDSNISAIPASNCIAEIYGDIPSSQSAGTEV